MKTLTINPKSLHYRLASVYGGLDPHQSTTTSCSYPRRVIWGLIITICIAAVSSLFIVLLASPLWYVIMGWIFGFINPVSVDVIVGTVIWGMFFIGVITFWYKEIIKPKMEVNRKAKHIPPHGVLYYCWMAFKDKVCVKIAIDGVGARTSRIPHKYWILFKDGRGYHTIYPAGENIPSLIIDNAQYIFDDTIDKDFYCEYHFQDQRRNAYQDSVRYANFLPWYKVNDLEFETEYSE